MVDLSPGQGMGELSCHAAMAVSCSSSWCQSARDQLGGGFHDRSQRVAMRTASVRDETAQLFGFWAGDCADVGKYDLGST